MKSFLDSLKQDPLLLAGAILFIFFIGTTLLITVPLSHLASKAPDLEDIPTLTRHPLETAGMDLFIREGCLKCHTQNIPNNRSSILRFGQPTKHPEALRRQPALLGTQVNIGPDLSRLGNQNDDSWHYQHFHNPRGKVPSSVMPSYSHLAQSKAIFKIMQHEIKLLEYDHKKSKNLKLIEARRQQLLSYSYNARHARNKITPTHLLSELTELDVLIFYVRSLKEIKPNQKKKKGKFVKKVTTTEPLNNPLKANYQALSSGKALFNEYCLLCHNEEEFPNLTFTPSFRWKYGKSDKAIYKSIVEGTPGGMPDWTSTLENDDIWKLILYIRSLINGK